jgi:hypothetical protein
MDMPRQENTDVLAPLAIGGGLAATPFLGLAGEQSITKDPYYTKGVKRLSPRELERLARPGDVILASQRTGTSMYKSPQLYTTGSEFYHAEPVIARSRGLGRTLPAGLLSELGAAKMTPKEVLRRGVKGYSEAIPFQDYGDIALMRPKKRLSKAEIAQFQQALLSGGLKPYSKPLGVRALFRDLFVPKVPGVTGHVGPQGPPIVCRGNMCSSLPAVTWKNLFKERIARGKHPKHTLPADFLRKGSPFEPIAASLQNPELLKHIQAKRMAFRGALGAGLGGAGVAAYHEPELIPGAAAAAGVPIGIRSILNRLDPKGLRGEQMLPSVAGVASETPEFIQALRAKKRMPKAMKSLFTRFGTRTLPLALGGGLAAYLGTKALTN